MVRSGLLQSRPPTGTAACTILNSATKLDQGHLLLIAKREMTGVGRADRVGHSSAGASYRRPNALSSTEHLPSRLQPARDRYSTRVIWKIPDTQAEPRFER